MLWVIDGEDADADSEDLLDEVLEGASPWLKALSKSKVLRKPAGCWSGLRRKSFRGRC